ncbi:MAG TPA: polymer-forming cytoskeletal protein [Vicinamibacterales bacterium]|nr:polymer-forming cytoskeletal protein [Vicinamibacterales bacterium]
MPSPVVTPVEPTPIVPQPEPVAVAPIVPVAPAKAKGSTLIIKGELVGSEDLVFEGHIEGKITLPEHVLTIGLGAQVSAEVVARVVVVHGDVTGNISAAERVEIKATGRMNGDLISPRVMMNDGATFNGRLETRTPGKHDGKGRNKQPELVAV